MRALRRNNIPYPVSCYYVDIFVLHMNVRFVSPKVKSHFTVCQLSSPSISCWQFLSDSYVDVDSGVSGGRQSLERKGLICVCVCVCGFVENNNNKKRKD